jgi:LTXXQ motif family protein
VRAARAVEEDTMWKAVLAGTAALAIAGSTLVSAQQRDAQPPGDAQSQRDMHEQMMREHMRAGGGQLNLEDMRAFSEARIAGLKAGLTLTADQEKNWPAFEQAARELAKLRIDRLSAAIETRRSGQPRAADPVDRLRRRADRMQETGAALKKLVDATDPLYKSLDDGQKRRFARLARFAEGGMDGMGMGRMGMEGMGRGGMRGMGGMMDGMRGHHFGGSGARDPHDGQDWRRQRFERQGFEQHEFEGGPSRSDFETRGSLQGEERL